MPDRWHKKDWLTRVWTMPTELSDKKQLKGSILKNKALLVVLILYCFALFVTFLFFTENKTYRTLYVKAIDKVNTTGLIYENATEISRAVAESDFMHIGSTFKQLQPAEIKCQGNKVILEIPVNNTSINDVVTMLQNHPKLLKLLNTSKNGSIANDSSICKSEEKEKGTASPPLTNTSGIDMSIRPRTLSHFVSLRSKEAMRQKRCHTCALVSSSGQLLGSRAGPDIDLRECVLRMNVAPSSGFERDVGTRTDFRIVSFVATIGLNASRKLFEGPEKPHVVLFWGLDKKKNAKALKIATELAKDYPGVRFYYQRSAGEQEANRVFKMETGRDLSRTKSWLSTGWFTILIALDLCEKIDIYGMVPQDFCKLNPKSPIKYHYHQTKADPKECAYYSWNEASTKGSHRFMTEKSVFAKWGKKYNMSFHHPEWSVEKEASKKLDTAFVHKFKKSK